MVARCVPRWSKTWPTDRPRELISPWQVNSCSCQSSACSGPVEPDGVVERRAPEGDSKSRPLAVEVRDAARRRPRRSAGRRYMYASAHAWSTGSSPMASFMRSHATRSRPVVRRSATNRRSNIASRPRSPRARPAAGPRGICTVCASGRRLVQLEARRHVEDGADRLAGDDRSRHERAAVADAIDLEPDRLLVVAAADEVGVQRVHPEGRIDGERSRLAAPAPRSGRRTARPTGTSDRCRRTCRDRVARASSSWRSPSAAVSGSAASEANSGRVVRRARGDVGRGHVDVGAVRPRSRRSPICSPASMTTRCRPPSPCSPVHRGRGASASGGARSSTSTCRRPTRRRSPSSTSTTWSIDWPRPSGPGSNATRSALLTGRVRARHRRRGELPATDVHRRVAPGRAGGRDGRGGGARR